MGLVIKLVVSKIGNSSIQNFICHVSWPIIPWKHICTSKIKLNSGSKDRQGSYKIIGRHWKSTFIVPSYRTAGWYNAIYIKLYIYFYVCVYMRTKIFRKMFTKNVISSFFTVLGFCFFLHTFLCCLKVFLIMNM